MTVFATPGVYVRHVEPEPVVRALRTDVAGFVGIAERGPLHRAVRVSSWERFREHFGEFRPGAHLAYAVKAFFDNGGRHTWIVRAADPKAAKAAFAELPASRASTTARAIVRARSPGVWGRRLAVRVVHSVRATTSWSSASGVGATADLRPGAVVRVKTPREVDQYAVLRELHGRRPLWHGTSPALTDASALEVVVFSVSVYEDGRLVELFPGLSLRAFAEDVEGALPLAGDVIFEGSTRITFEEQGTLDATDLPAEGMYALTGGEDGLSSLRPEHLTGSLEGVEEFGLQKLEAVDEVALIAVPDAVTRPAPPRETLPPSEEPDPDPCVPCAPEAPQPRPARAHAELEMPRGFSDPAIVAMQLQMLSHCERLRDRFALLDPPAPSLERSELLDWRQRFDSSYGAVFYPWLEVVDPARPTSGAPLVVPPCGHVAGSYARVDLSEGVHVVGANRALSWAVAPRVAVDDREQAELNPLGINCIRSFRGRGVRIYGGRTLSSDSTLRYVNVRRLLMMIAEALREQLAWAAFEPHDGLLRRKLTLVTSGFLQTLWARGAFTGSTPEESFFVRCDDVTNPPEAVLAGELHALVGVAIVRPAEFVLLTIGRGEGRLEVGEGGRPWR